MYNFFMKLYTLCTILKVVLVISLNLKVKTFYKHNDGFVFYCHSKVRGNKGQVMVDGLPDNFAGPLRREDFSEIENAEIITVMNNGLCPK